MYYARVMFDLASGNFLNKQNETDGFEIFAKRDGYNYLKRIVRIDKGVNSYLNVSFFVGPFDDIEICKKYGKQLFYAVLKYYFWVDCPFIIDTDITEIRINADMGHFITKQKDRCDINSLQIIEVEKNLGEYYKREQRIELVSYLQQTFPIEDFEKNQLEYNDFCSNVFNLLNVAQSASSYRFSIPILCTAIEYMANEKICRENKTEEEVAVFDFLIKKLKECEEIPQEIKASVNGYLYQGKKLGSKKKCKLLIQKYAKREYSFKHNTIKYVPLDIFNYCYDFRSKNSHGDRKSDEEVNNLYLQLMKYVVLDILENILREEQSDVKNYFEPKRMQIGCYIK